MKAIKFRMVGTTPLMLNNPQTVNPMNAYAKAIKELTSKRTKTDEDMQELLHLKFVASCYYTDRGQYIIPSNMIAKSIESGAKENKLGSKFQRSVFITEDALLKFDDDGCSPEELWENHAEKYVDIRAVGVMKSKIVTARMIVPQWSIDVELVFDDTQINDGEVWNAIKIAGLRYGIGTYRPQFGRFRVEELKTKK